MLSNRGKMNFKHFWYFNLSVCIEGGKPIFVEIVVGRMGEACGVECKMTSGAKRESSFVNIC